MHSACSALVLQENRSNRISRIELPRFSVDIFVLLPFFPNSINSPSFGCCFFRAFPLGSSHVLWEVETFVSAKSEKRLQHPNLGKSKYALWRPQRLGRQTKPKAHLWWLHKSNLWCGSCQFKWRRMGTGPYKEAETWNISWSGVSGNLLSVLYTGLNLCHK